jgi:Carboxypeptidase regulatory-like domain
MCGPFRQTLIASLTIGVLAAGCTGNPSSPSIVSPTLPGAAPTPTPAPPAPGSSTSLNGRVTETAPTSSTGIAGAVLRIVDGAAAGRSTTADPQGYYRIDDVPASGMLSVSAPGYVETTRAIDLSREGSNFQLMPTPTTKTSTMADTLDSGVGKCSDGVSMEPCHILAIPIHNRGPLEATLTWDSDGGDLDLSLFQSGTSSFISRSASRGTKSERIAVDLSVGANYDLRVTYAEGTEAVKYTLQVTHPN